MGIQAVTCYELHCTDCDDLAVDPDEERVLYFPDPEAAAAEVDFLRWASDGENGYLCPACRCARAGHQWSPSTFWQPGSAKALRWCETCHAVERTDAAGQVAVSCGAAS